MKRSITLVCLLSVFVTSKLLATDTKYPSCDIRITNVQGTPIQELTLQCKRDLVTQGGCNWELQGIQFYLSPKSVNNKCLTAYWMTAIYGGLTKTAMTVSSGSTAEIGTLHTQDIPADRSILMQCNVPLCEP